MPPKHGDRRARAAVGRRPRPTPRAAVSAHCPKYPLLYAWDCCPRRPRSRRGSWLATPDRAGTPWGQPRLHILAVLVK